MRRATLKDLPALVDLETQLFPGNNMNETTLQNELELGECWLATDVADTEIWGYCLVRRDGELLDLLRLGVLPNKRGMGVGSDLLNQVISGDDPVMLTVKKDNELAMKLYFRHGFHIVGHLASDAGWVMKRPTSSSK
jgi:[ribosomal protein S18]-alanine N-acetyltransferase